MRAALLALVFPVMTCCAAQQATIIGGCAPVDFLSAMADGDPYVKEILGDSETTWLRDAIQCETDTYTLLVPRDSTENRYVLLRKGKNRSSVVRLEPDSVTVIEGFDLHATLADTDHDGRADSIDYSTWRYQGDRFVDAKDWNLDGQPDLRTTEDTNGRSTYEAWLNGSWHDIVLENGFRLAEPPHQLLRKGEDGSFQLSDGQ